MHVDSVQPTYAKPRETAERSSSYLQQVRNQQ